MAVDLGFALLIGLGGMKLVQLYKEITARIGLEHQLAWWKSLLSLVVCLGLALLVPHRSLSARILVGLGAAGFAAGWHAVDTVLRSHRDQMVRDVLVKSRSRSR